MVVRSVHVRVTGRCPAPGPNLTTQNQTIMTTATEHVGRSRLSRLPSLLCATILAAAVPAQCPQGADAALVPWSGPAGYTSADPVDDEGLSPHLLGFWFPMPNPNGSGIPVVFDQIWVGTNGELYLTVSSLLLPQPIGGSTFGVTTALEMQGSVAGGSARVVPFGCDLMKTQVACNTWQVTVDTSVANEFTVTWTDVALFTTGSSSDRFSFACTLYANGSVDCSYGTTFPAGLGTCAVGLSTGNLIAGPAANLSATPTSTNGLLYELFTLSTFDLAGKTLHIGMNGGFTGYVAAALAPYLPPTCASHCASGVGCYDDPNNGVYPLTLSAAPRPVRDSTGWVAFDYTLTNVPELFPCAGIGVTAILLSLGPVIPGIDLDFLGYPGCFVYMPTLDVIGPAFVWNSTPCVPYMTATPHPFGAFLPPSFDFYAQGMALVVPPSPLTLPPYSNAGILTSNVVHHHVESQ
jgi:hypothetical protein